MVERHYRIWTIAIGLLSIIVALTTCFSIILYNEHSTDVANTLYIREKLAAHDTKLSDISSDVSRIDRNVETMRNNLPVKKAAQ